MDLAAFSDAEGRGTILRALRLLAIMTVVALPVVWWKLGWQSAVMLLAGAAVSAAGLWKWIGLLAVLAPQQNEGETPQTDIRPRSTIPAVLTGFFLTFGVMLVVLYGSLKLLNGSVYALFLGLVLGIVALTVEALKLVKSMTI
jgi:hypothetical protein